MFFDRRRFMQTLAGGTVVIGSQLNAEGTETEASQPPAGVSISTIKANEDLFGYMRRQQTKFDATLYRQLLGAANEFKEGDVSAGVAAANAKSRANARTLLSRTRLQDISTHPVFNDGLHKLISGSLKGEAGLSAGELTLGELKQFLLTKSEEEIEALSAGLSSDVIGCLVKLMSNRELIAVGRKIFNPLPGSHIGSRGYLGARIQPNSPTDNLDDIRWQVFNGWSYAVGDALLGTNPVSSEPESVLAVELALKDLLVTFGIEDVLPHCVLSHIDVQAQVEEARPGSTALWFQSIAGSDDANETFDISIDKMLRYADERTGKYGLYFETGQGADLTNEHGHGFDMVLHESRKYGFARVLKHRVAAAQMKAGRPVAPWVHLNNVAGFIGPEVFRTREQLVRCCLEDIVMGKLHGLTIGLDVCSTLHMDVSLDDLDYCLDRIMPANPAYLMALPTKNDPMLGYLTTGFQDHVRIRERFGYKVDDRMWRFFQELQVIDAAGNPTEHFGDPVWVYLQYRRRKGDARHADAIRREGQTLLDGIRSRGVFIAQGYGKKPWQLNPQLDTDIRNIYDDSKKSLWTELTPEFITAVPDAQKLATRSRNREDYILHPTTGEKLSIPSLKAVHALRRKHAGRYDVQIVVSDGLNALAISDEGHLLPFLQTVRDRLVKAGFRAASENLVVGSGRVRAGYRIGEQLFAGLTGNRVILHIIGERPGTGHHTFSVYLTIADASVWSKQGKVDHNITKVVSGIATTALAPKQGAIEVVALLEKASADGRK